MSACAPAMSVIRQALTLALVATWRASRCVGHAMYLDEAEQIMVVALRG